MTSGTSPPPYGPHRRIITNREKGLSYSMQWKHKNRLNTRFIVGDVGCSDSGLRKALILLTMFFLNGNKIIIIKKINNKKVHFIQGCIQEGRWALGPRPSGSLKGRQKRRKKRVFPFSSFWRKKRKERKKRERKEKEKRKEDKKKKKINGEVNQHDERGAIQVRGAPPLPPILVEIGRLSLWVP